MSKYGIHGYRHDPPFSEVRWKLLNDLTYFELSPEVVVILYMKNTLDKINLGQYLSND